MKSRKANRGAKTMSATKSLKQTLNLRREPVAFRSLELAIRFAARAKALWVMHGDDCAAWVVCPADAARLEKAGYEYAPVC